MRRFIIINKLFFHASFLLLLLCGLPGNGHSQKSKADSIIKLLKTETVDTNRVLQMWQLAKAVYLNNPDTALQLAQEALHLSKRIDYTEGQSLSLGILATTFR